MFDKGGLGKLAAGFGRLTAAVGTAWAAFESGQKIRAEIEEFFRTGAEKAERFSDALTNSALDPAEALKETNKQIDALQKKIAFVQGTPLAWWTDTKKLQQEVAELNKKAGAYNRTLDAIKRGQIARDARGRLAKAEDAALEFTAPLYERKRFADEAIFQRRMKRLREEAARENDPAVRDKLEERIRSEDALHQREKAKAERRNVEDVAHERESLNAKLLRDEEEIIKRKASLEKDAGKKKALEAQARALEIKAIEIDAALTVAALKRRIEDEDDAAARKILQDQIRLEEERKKIAIKALDPEKPLAKEHSDLAAMRRNSAEAARTIFSAANRTAGSRQGNDLEAIKRGSAAQTKLQERALQTLKRIEANQRRDVEVSLL
jgi:hypothetical protein